MIDTITISVQLSEEALNYILTDIIQIPQSTVLGYIRSSYLPDNSVYLSYRRAIYNYTEDFRSKINFKYTKWYYAPIKKIIFFYNRYIQFFTMYITFSLIQITSAFYNSNVFNASPIFVKCFQIQYNHFFSQFFPPSRDENIDCYLNQLYNFSLVTVYRIEYSYDFVIDPPSLVPLYIKLFNSACIDGTKYKFKRSTRYKSNSLYLYSKSMAITFYDKHREVLDRSHLHHPAVRDDTIGVLRYEVKLKKKKLDKLQLSNLTLITSQTARDILLSYASAVFPTGDFYKSKELSKIINAADITTRQKNSLLRIIKSIQTSKSVIRAIGKETVCSASTFRNHLKAFDGLNISPLPIPIDDYKAYRLGALSSTTTSTVLSNPLKQIA